MLAYKFIEKDFCNRLFGWNKFNFVQEIFPSTSLRDASRTPANI